MATRTPSRPSRRALSLLVVLSTAALFVSCATGDADEGAARPGGTTGPYPGDEWPTADPAGVGLDPEALAAMRSDLESKTSDCVAIVKGGALVEATAFRGTTIDDDREAFSASKSITSTLVGIAQEQGYLTIDQPASDFITEWKGTPSESVTIRNLLANDSGRTWDFVTDYVMMAFQAPDKTGFAIGLGQAAPPGTEWNYNNSAIQTLEAVLERATGQDVGTYAEEQLFAPIGMSSTIARDDAGNPLVFMGTQASCLDLARFGYLFLQRGRWGDQQVVPEAWVDQATSVSQSIQPIYGLLWWLNKDGDPQWAVPEDAYAAIGLGGQVVLVVPSWDLVAVRMGGGFEGDGGGADMARLLAEHLQRAVAPA